MSKRIDSMLLSKFVMQILRESMYRKFSPNVICESVMAYIVDKISGLEDFEVVADETGVLVGLQYKFDGNWIEMETKCNILE